MATRQQLTKQMATHLEPLREDKLAMMLLLITATLSDPELEFVTTVTERMSRNGMLLPTGSIPNMPVTSGTSGLKPEKKPSLGEKE